MNGEEFGQIDWLRTFLLAPVTMFVNEVDNAPDNQANQAEDRKQGLWDGAHRRPRIAVFQRRQEQDNHDRGRQGPQGPPGPQGPQGPPGPQGQAGQTVIREIIRERGGENMVEVPVEQMMETFRDAGAAEVLRDQQQWNRTIELKKNIEGEIRQVVKVALEKYKDGDDVKKLDKAVELITRFTGEQIYELLNAMGYDNTVLEDRQGREVAKTILKKMQKMLSYDPERLEKMFDYMASFAGLNGETVKQYKAGLEEELQEYQAQLREAKNEAQEYQALLREAKNEAQEYQARAEEAERQLEYAEEAERQLEYVKARIQGVPDKGIKRGRKAYEALSDVRSHLEGGDYEPFGL